MPSDSKRAEREIVSLKKKKLKIKLIFDGLENKHLSDFKHKVLLYSTSHSPRNTIFLDN